MRRPRLAFPPHAINPSTYLLPAAEAPPPGLQVHLGEHAQQQHHQRNAHGANPTMNLSPSSLGSSMTTRSTCAHCCHWCCAPRTIPQSSHSRGASRSSRCGRAVRPPTTKELLHAPTRGVIPAECADDDGNGL